MKKKLNKVERTCYRKRGRYKTLADAVAEVGRLKAEPDVVDPERLTGYQCQNPREEIHYHVGHVPKIGNYL